MYLNDTNVKNHTLLVSIRVSRDRDRDRENEILPGKRRRLKKRLRSIDNLNCRIVLENGCTIR